MTRNRAADRNLYLSTIFGRRYFQPVLPIFCFFLIAPVFTPVLQAATPDGSGITIAVMDSSGIDSASPELAGAIVHEVCLDSMAGFTWDYGAACPNKKAIDEDAGAATTIFTGTGDVKYPAGGHGTAVASVIAGATVGVAKGVKIVAIKELHQMSPAFEWIHANAKQYGINAVVMSEAWSSSPDSRSYVPCSLTRETNSKGQDVLLSPFIDQLRADGLAIFFAAGNESNTSMIDSPSCIKGVFSVGATAENVVAGYTNISSDISILAPGTNMVSTVVAKNSFSVTSQMGTSFAGPYAGAVYAKVKSLYPNLNADQILAAMRTTGDLVDDIKVKSIPRINQDALFAFLASGKEIPSLESTFTNQKASFSNGGSGSLTVQEIYFNNQIKKLQGQIDTLTTTNKALSDQLEIAKSTQADLAQLQSQMADLKTANESQIAALKDANEVLLKKLATLAKKSIICTKAGTTKKVIGLNPNCPVGWKMKA